MTIKQTKQKHEHIFQAKQTGNVVRLIRYFSNNPSVADYKATFVCDIDYNNTALHVYTSMCTPQDNFCKDTGVKLALQRAHNKDGFSIKLTKEPIIQQILHALIDLIILKDENQFIKMPSRSVKNSLSNII